MDKKKALTKKEKPSEHLPSSYPQVLKNIKVRIHEAKVKASLSVNQELIKLYWDVGQLITEKQKQEKWGAKVIEKLGEDLQKEFPGIEGFSRRNVFRMKKFYTSYQIVPQAVALIENLPIFRIPWGHNAVLLEKLKGTEERLWYAQRAIEKGWSRSNLEMWIESDLRGREGKGITNFKSTLPKPDSDLAQQAMRDPYCLDFLMLSDEAKEKEIEQGLMNHLQKFLLELGEGFAFVGRQYPLCVEGDTYYLDLLFFNLKLRCYVVVELKAREFDLRDTGQMNFYLAAVDDMLRHLEDRPTIGILICKTKKKLKAQYAVANLKRPINISSYELIAKSLPKELKPSLPSIAQIEEELNKDLKKD
jgi:predicted nuclease of restriction endonuclease-like (RecB) superfamily